MTAAGRIAARLGGSHRSGRWWSCRCPAHNDRAPSLSLRDGDFGLIVRCWAGCDPRDVLNELRRRGLIAGDVSEGGRRPEPIEQVRRRETEARDEANRINAARLIWNAAKRAQETPVVAYLLARGITLSPPSSLRWALALRRPDGAPRPAMIARIDNLDGELIGVARTWLALDDRGAWRRQDRRMLGGAAGRAARSRGPRADGSAG